MLKHEVGRIEHASVMYLEHEIRDAIAVGVAKDVGDMIARHLNAQLARVIGEGVRADEREGLILVRGFGVRVDEVKVDVIDGRRGSRPTSFEVPDCVVRS